MKKKQPTKQALFYNDMGGFTLHELIVVIVIIIILLIVGLPRMSDLEPIKLQNAAFHLIAHIRWTQALSISEQKTYRIIFDETNDSYEVWEYSGGSPVQLAKDPSTGKDLVMDYPSSDAYQDIDLDVLESSWLMGHGLEFDEQGRPINTALGSTMMFSTYDVMVSLGSGGGGGGCWGGSGGAYNITIRIYPITGKVDIA